MDRVSTEVFRAEKPRWGGEPEPLLDFVDGLQAAIGLIPVAHRKSAYINFECGDDDPLEITIYYDRRPTKAEIKADEDAAREQIEARTQQNRARELALLAELKRKYEGA